MKRLLTLTLLAFTFLLTAQDFNAEHFKSMKARNIGPAGMSGRVTAIDVDLSNENRIFSTRTYNKNKQYVFFCDFAVIILQIVNYKTHYHLTLI